MKPNLTSTAMAVVLAMAMGTGATPSLAQSSYSDTYSNPSDTQRGADEMPPPASPDMSSPGTTNEAPGMNTPPQGPQGPIRSDETSQGSTSMQNPSDRSYRSNSSYSASDRGYEGYLMWQRNNSNSP